MIPQHRGERRQDAVGLLDGVCDHRDHGRPRGGDGCHVHAVGGLDRLGPALAQVIGGHVALRPGLGVPESVPGLRANHAIGMQPLISLERPRRAVSERPEDAVTLAREVAEPGKLVLQVQHHCAAVAAPHRCAPGLRQGSVRPPDAEDLIDGIERVRDLVALVAAAHQHPVALEAHKEGDMPLPARGRAAPEHHHVAGSGFLQRHLAAPLQIAAGVRLAGAGDAEGAEDRADERCAPSHRILLHRHSGGGP